MALNVEKLVHGLEEYNDHLDKHLGQLQNDFNTLQEYFFQLSASYDGQAAEQFKISWGRTAEWFEQYTRESQELSRFLNERVSALKEQGNI